MKDVEQRFVSAPANALHMRPCAKLHQSKSTMSVQEQLERLQQLAAQDAGGDATAHNALLKGIRELQLTVETPIETTSRLNFQVQDPSNEAYGRITANR